MNNPNQISDENSRERSIAKMREISIMFDAQIMVLDELIAKVEAENRHNSVSVYRQERGTRLLASLQKEED